MSLIGLLARNAASNPFEVAQAFAVRTGGSVQFLPVPFLADTALLASSLMKGLTIDGDTAIALHPALAPR